MRKAELVVIACVAVMTFCSAMMLRGTLGVAVADPVIQNGKEIPILKSGRVECTLTLKNREYKAGDKPVLLLTATNNGKEAEEIAATVRLMRMRAMSAFARSMPRPENIWTNPYMISLSPNQTETIEVAASVTLEKGNQYLFQMKAGESEIVAAQIELPDETRLIEGIPANAQLPGRIAYSSVIGR